jgi:flagellin-like hook-associated protein FlgL
MGSDVVLSAGVRQNLLSLQSTAQLMSITQNRLATGKRVNSALDNPVNFFTSSGLTSRAGDLSALLDSMENGIKTIEAADNGITSIKKTIESMKSTLLQARQDKSFKSSTYSVALTAPAATDVLALSGGAVTGTVNVDLTNSQGVLTASSNYANLDFAEAGDIINFKLALDGSSTTTQVTIENGTAANSLKITVGGVVTDNLAVASEAGVTGAEMSAHLTTAFAAANLGVSVTGLTGSPLVFTATTAATSSMSAVTMSNLVIANGGAGTALAAANFGFTAGGVGVSAGGTASKTGVVAQTVDELIAGINANANLVDKVTASNDSGKLRISNLSTGDLTLIGATAGGVVNGDIGAANTATVGGNVVRRNLVKQYNDLRDQLNKLADDSSFNGINLLRGDKLRINFNELGTSSIIIQAQDEFGVPRPINTSTLGIDFLLNPDVDADASIDGFLDDLSASLNTLRSQASSFGSNLSLVEIRTEFTKKMINTLQVGADNLVLADTNEEGANMLALQTRQQLSTTALSLASQADQAVLRLFG